MTVPRLTLRSIELRSVSIPLKRPVVSKVGRFDRWPLVLIDLHTEEGIVGRSYLEPYLERSVRYLVPAIRDLAGARTGRPIAPLDDFRIGRAGLNLIGLEGVSMNRRVGARHGRLGCAGQGCGLPLAIFLGGSLAPVPAHNSNGVWLTPVDAPRRNAVMERSPLGG
jgi:mandelate racemase